MNKIKHFMLPEHTNKLYTKEAISSISLTRDVADKINELIDAYNALSEIDLTWKQEQEGTIRKAILYIKDNLINTLHDLVELLENEGFFKTTIKSYTTELEKRLDNLLTAETIDGELIDIRYGANDMTYKTAGEAVREQLKGLMALIVNENLLTDVMHHRGYYTLKANGEEYLEGGDGLILKDRDEVYTDLIAVEAFTDMVVSVISDNRFVDDDMWISVHFYDANKKYIKREFTTNTGTFVNLYFNTGNFAYIRINYRCYTMGCAKLEKGVFSTLKSLNDAHNVSSNIIDGYPLKHECFYSWGKDGFVHSFKSSANKERSTDFVKCEGNKKITLFYNYGVDGWASVNFITKDGYFTLLNSSSETWVTDINNGIDENVNNVMRYIVNTTGCYEIEIPEQAYAFSISTRTLNLNNVAVFVDDIESYERKYYELLFDSYATNDAIKAGDGDIPFTTPFEMKDVAHRGMSSLAPENTKPAYIKAYENGFKYVECDVNFTSDNVPILIHDNTVDRTSNGTGAVSSLTYETISTLDFGSWFSSDFADTKIMSFDEFISVCKKLKLHPYIEIKGDTSITEEQIDILINIVKTYGMIKNVSWICFEYSNLETIVSKVKTARVGYLVSTLTNSAVDMTKALRTGNNETFVDTNAYSNESIAYALENDVAVERYTIDSEDEIISQSPYISGVTSNSLLASEVLKNSVGV
ncbi:MAG: hypothetical protein IJX16_00200 [Clostridia bacterium]|nr:hypothetical protein [Clostridia bacterium]